MSLKNEQTGCRMFRSEELLPKYGSVGGLHVVLLPSLHTSYTLPHFRNSNTFVTWHLGQPHMSHNLRPQCLCKCYKLCLKHLVTNIYLRQEGSVPLKPKMYANLWPLWSSSYMYTITRQNHCRALVCWRFRVCAMWARWWEKQISCESDSNVWCAFVYSGYWQK